MARYNFNHQSINRMLRRFHITDNKLMRTYTIEADACTESSEIEDIAKLFADALNHCDSQRPPMPSKTAEDVAREILNKYSNDYFIGDIPRAAAEIQSFADSQIAELREKYERLKKQLQLAREKFKEADRGGSRTGNKRP